MIDEKEIGAIAARAAARMSEDDREKFGAFVELTSAHIAAMETKLRDLESWLDRILESKLQHQGGASAAGHPCGGAVVKVADIPEWEIRRHIDECRDAIDGPIIGQDGVA